MSQLKMNEDATEILEEELKPTETKLEDLEKEDLIRIINDKQVESDHYKSGVEHLTNNNKELVSMYNKDMQYMTTINSNLITTLRKKEDAIKNIIENTLVLLTIDRDVIAPERKEDN